MGCIGERRALSSVCRPYFFLTESTEWYYIALFQKFILDVLRYSFKNIKAKFFTKAGNCSMLSISERSIDRLGIFIILFPEYDALAKGIAKHPERQETMR